MQVNDWLKKYPDLIHILKEAGVHHRSHIISIELDRSSQKEFLPFVRGSFSTKANGGTFTVKTKTHRITISVRFDSEDKFSEHQYEVSEYTNA